MPQQTSHTCTQCAVWQWHSIVQQQQNSHHSCSNISKTTIYHSVQAYVHINRLNSHSDRLRRRVVPTCVDMHTAWTLSLFSTSSITMGPHIPRIFMWKCTCSVNGPWGNSSVDLPDNHCCHCYWCRMYCQDCLCLHPRDTGKHFLQQSVPLANDFFAMAQHGVQPTCSVYSVVVTSHTQITISSYYSFTLLQSAHTRHLYCKIYHSSNVQWSSWQHASTNSGQPGKLLLNGNVERYNAGTLTADWHTIPQGSPWAWSQQGGWLNMAALALILCYFQYHFANTFCLVTKAEVTAHEISYNCYHTFPYMYTVYEVQRRCR